MSQHHNNKFSNPILSLSRSIRIAVRRMTRQTLRSLLRVWIKINRQGRYGRAGFVLPTVTMVLLVVVLLTITIMLRSMDRAKMAQYRRVDEQVLQAATPALDRASAKIEYLLNQDKSLPLATPSDDELYRALNNISYKFEGEEVLSIQIPPPPNSTEPENYLSNNAWRFPVDTNNDGTDDSYVLYGIYFRLPKTARARIATEARTPPMKSIQSGAKQCASAGSSADLIDGSGWSKQDGKLKKSFFVYTTTVPMPDANGEVKGTAGFTALEYQQDRTRIPFSNNAVVYEDDLEVAPGPAFRLNGRIFTNSNLITTPGSTNTISYYLVSSPASCFYEIENSKIVVGGNVVNGTASNANNKGSSTVDLFKAATSFTATNKTISTTDRSTTQEAAAVLYNNNAYENRISLLVKSQLTSTDPDTVQKAIKTRTDQDSTLDLIKAREEELETYFRERTRRVPYVEAPAGDLGVGSYSISTKPIAGSGNNLRPVDLWARPFNPANPATSYTGITLKDTQLKAQEPPKNPENEVELGDRVLVGNNQPKLAYTGNTTAPFFEAAKVTLGKWTGTQKDRERPTQIQTLPNVGSVDRHGFWEKAAAQKPDPLISGYGGLRVVTGAGIYERSSSFLPPPAWDDPETPSASVDESKYGDKGYPIVWPDTMPMSPTKLSKVYDNVAKKWIDNPGWPLTVANSAAPTDSLDPKTPKYAKGDLKMRATAVYHYAQDIFEPEKSDTTQKPIACISSYYDPSNRLTSLNTGDFPLSNNGKVYGPPTTARPGKSTGDPKVGLLGSASPTVLENQANLVFPDGRFVNERLRIALTQEEAKRDLGDQSAIDSALCALGILGTTGYNLGSVPSATTFPEGAIKETAFLNAREVKAVETDNTTTTIDETFTVRSSSDPTTITGQLTTSYAMPLENRFPQEIRATVIDLGVLRNQPITIATTGPSPEYLLPNSGIIYATRDDALPDLSDKNLDTTVRGSGSDFKLDPSRRPNAIVVVNGKYLARNDIDNNGQNDTALPADAKQATEKILQEKGLILVSDVPVYIKGEFNLHNAKDGSAIQEFKESLNATWSNFYTRKTLNTDFACRPGDPRLKPNCTSTTGGDTWRPATVLADAVTLLSDNFRFGFRNEGDFDLRNNAGNAKIGYDLNGNGDIKASDPTTTEIAFADTNSDGTININSNEFWIDLNGNGINDGSLNIREIDITANAARIINGFNQSNNFVTNGLSSGAFSQTLDANKNPQVVGSASDLRLSDSHYLTTNTTAVDSSYFNNFVTPIQRRVQFSEYVMEVCRKVPISACGPNDWVIGYDVNNDDDFEDNAEVSATKQVKDAAGNVKKESDLTLYDLLVNVPKELGIYDLDSQKNKFNPPGMFSGTTGYWRITEGSQRLPRRVGFLRSQGGMIRLDQMNRPIIVGIADPGNGAGADVKNGWLQCYVSADVTTPDYQAGGEYRHRVDPNESDMNKNYLCPKLGDKVGGQVQEPRTLNPNNNEAVPPLWFVTNNGGTRNYGSQYPLWFYNPTNPATPVTLTHGKPQQPLLIPVLQLHATDKTPTATEAKNFSDFPVGSILGEEGKAQSRWLIPAKAGTTTYNLVLGSGNGPSRPTESNGGLENFPRLIENWLSGTTGTRGTVQILGSFIQIRRSRYATAPAIPLQLRSGSTNNDLVTAPAMFGVATTNFSDVYNFNNVDRRVSYYTASNRNWGFDVGILSQPPDLFAQKFTAPSTEAPDNYFREVSRDDDWVKYLLCSKLADPNDPTKATNLNAVPDSIRRSCPTVKP